MSLSVRSSLLAFASAFLVAQAPTHLRVGGGAAPIENIFKPIQESLLKTHGITLELNADGPDVAFRLLDQGKLDGASAGLGWGSWLELMKAKGYDVKDPKAYHVETIGEDQIHIFLSPELAVFKLTEAEVQGLLTGTITNWKEAGGPDLPVVPILGTKVPGTNKVFQEKLLGGKPFAPGARTAGTSPEVIALIAQTPGGIGFGPMSAKENFKVWCPPEAPIATRPILFITKGEPSEAIKRMLAFIRAGGKP
jgi:phosphate transport system substrate-binding protein